jgi:NAD(P)-dependent dehydrogenase (short-subunit alcohol dehydrogenase family)
MNTQELLGLDGNVALITGASGGFGAAIAMILARAGARVALVGRDRRKLRPVADELGEHALLVEGDVSRPGEADRIVQSVVETLGRLDILVNNAGGATVGGLLSLSDEHWQADIDLKLLGYMRMMRAAARVMRAHRGGRIVNVLGLAGHEPYHLITAPSVVNAGLLALTKTAADELANDRILVNALNPNAAITGRGDRMIAELAAAQNARSEDVRTYLLEATPLGRLAQPDDVARAVLFYVSDLAPFITGTSLTIDGGSHRAIA